jgi:tetratricopeptide (TPR) repeat protein
MPEPTLGLVMILKNEAANLKHSLEPVAGCFDEVVAVDTGSTDATPELCAGLGARVHRLRWGHDFAAARNYSISQAKADWLFWLDGDNGLRPREVAALRGLLPAAPAVVWALERVVPGGQQLWQKRCFPNHPAVRFAGRVHEQLVHPPEWPQLAAPVTVRHWGYADPVRCRDKGQYYRGLLEQMLAEDPADYYARFQLARTHLNLRQAGEAAPLLEAVAADPGARAQNPQLWAQAHFLLAQCRRREGRGQDAADILDGLLQKTPELGLAHYHRGRLAWHLGRAGAAARHLAKALELGLEQPFLDLDPGKTRFWAQYFLGRALADTGRPNEALAAYRAAAQAQPANPAPRTDAARLLLALGRRRAARRELEQALEHTPGDRAARRLLARLEEAA